MGKPNFPLKFVPIFQKNNEARLLRMNLKCVTFVAIEYVLVCTNQELRLLIVMNKRYSWSFVSTPALTFRLVCKFWRDSISANKQLKARIKHTSVLRAVKMGPLSTNVVSRVADVNKIYQTGMTPLVYAVLNGKTEVVEILISHGADINQTDTLPINRSQMKGYVTKTPLCHAAMKGHKDIAELLIRKGANVNLYKPLLLALEHKHTCVAKLLISNGTNINQKKVCRKELECSVECCDGRAPVTALHIAVDNGDLEIVKLLIENKAALCARNGNQMCYQDPLHIALKRSNPEIAKCLIRAGSNVNAVFMHEHFLQVW